MIARGCRVASLAFLLLSSNVAATHAQGPPIHTDTPIMLGIEGRGVRTFLKAVRMDELLRNGDEIFDPADRSVTAFLYPIAVPFNIAANTQVGVIGPFLKKDVRSNTGDVSNSGVGDVTVFFKQLVFKIDRRAETFRIAVKGSAKFPTGDDDGTPKLGTGSVDYGVSAVAGWIKSRWGIYGETIYQINTSNNGVDFGDRFLFNTSVGYRVLPAHYTHYPQPQLNAYIELNGRVTARSDAGGVENPDSGGSLLMLSPGVQYVGGRRWLVEASVQLPLSDEPNGVQLGTAWTVTVGTRILVF